MHTIRYVQSWHDPLLQQAPYAKTRAATMPHPLRLLRLLDLLLRHALQRGRGVPLLVDLAQQHDVLPPHDVQTDGHLAEGHTDMFASVCMRYITSNCDGV